MGRPRYPDAIPDIDEPITTAMPPSHILWACWKTSCGTVPQPAHLT